MLSKCVQNAVARLDQSWTSGWHELRMTQHKTWQIFDMMDGPGRCICICIYVYLCICICTELSRPSRLVLTMKMSSHWHCIKRDLPKTWEWSRQQRLRWGVVQLLFWLDNFYEKEKTVECGFNIFLWKPVLFWPQTILYLQIHYLGGMS